MKQLIVPIAIIVALIAVFVVIDRKDFYSGDDVAVQNETVTRKSTTVATLKPVETPVETKPVEVKLVVETKPVAETKPVTEAKPAEAKPVAETKSAEGKPAETKPVAETKPAEVKPVETKPTETKPAETKPVAQTKPEEKLLPAAVPSLTAEEAERLNEEAKEYASAEKERKEPFFKLYQDTKLVSVCIQGTIRAISTIPDPEKNDYDNCLYSLFVEIDSLLSDVMHDTPIPSEVIINAPIMKDKTILQDNQFQPGDKVWCTCTEYDAMPQGIQEIQLSDDIQSYEHQQYYPFRINKISSFLKGGIRNFAKKEITIIPVQTLPKDEKAATLRDKRIKNEIYRIEEEIKRHGGSFEKWKEEYKSIAEKYKKLSSEGYKGWIKNSYFSAIGSETTYNTKAYIDWILPYKRYLQSNNIDLIILRYPKRSDFAARVLASDDFQENPAWVEHYYKCLKEDIEIVDPMPEMWAKRFDYPLFYFYNSDVDLHPLEGELIVAAEKIAGVLSRYSYPSNRSFELNKRSINLNGYKYPAGHPSFPPDKPIIFDGLSEKGEIVSLQANTGSPFVFLSNSYFGYKAMQNQGASVPHYTCFFLQQIVDWKYQSAVRNAMIRNFIDNPSNLHKRRAVIMVGNFETWTSGPKIPSYLFNGASKITLENELNFLSPNVVLETNDPQVEVNKSNGCLTVLKRDTPFGLKVKVPPLFACDYKTCMIRIIFEDVAQNIRIIARNSNGIIDETSLTINVESYTDLFVPIEQLTDDFKIEFSGGYKPYTIKCIELWYY